MSSSDLIDIEIIEQGADAIGREEMLGLCRLMVETCQGDVERISPAEEDEARRILHGIAGAAANCGARRLAEEARRLERSECWTPEEFATLAEIVRETGRWIETELPMALAQRSAGDA